MEGQPGYEKCTKTRNPVEFLVMLRDVMHKHNSRKDKTMVIVESDMQLYLGIQGKTDTIDKFLRLFISRADTIITHGGTPCHHPGQARRILEQEKEKEVMDKTTY